MDDSFKLSLQAKTVIITVALSVISNAVYGFLTGDINWVQILIVTAIMVAVVALVAATPFFRKLFVSRSGVVDYIDSVSVDQVSRYWPQAKSDFMYAGVTGSTILQHLHPLIENEAGDRCHYRFLLLNPECNAYRLQIAFLNGFDINRISTEHERSVTAEIEAARQNFKAFIATISICRAALSTPCRIEVRTCEVFTPWWICMLDNKKIILGIILSEKGKRDNPAAIMRRSEKEKVNLFSAFNRNLESLWNSGQPVDLRAISNG